jgi:hypothetical protein
MHTPLTSRWRRSQGTIHLSHQGVKVSEECFHFIKVFQRMLLLPLLLLLLLVSHGLVSVKLLCGLLGYVLGAILGPLLYQHCTFVIFRGLELLKRKTIVRTTQRILPLGFELYKEKS